MRRRNKSHPSRMAPLTLTLSPLRGEREATAARLRPAQQRLSRPFGATDSLSHPFGATDSLSHPFGATGSLSHQVGETSPLSRLRERVGVRAHASAKQIASFANGAPHPDPLPTAWGEGIHCCETSASA